jgi:WD40 repeat protein
MYDGFISYSHAADDLLAPRLQAGLQRFAKPWWKRRAVRIFRDEASLAANPHLWSSITEALDDSSWFVLLLSPDAASSEWVGKEIEHWVANKSLDRILPVVTDGEFTWENGDVAGSSIPPALQGVFSEEPRWVDLRFARGETHLDLQNPDFSAAVADIASAIRGIPKDELASEEVRQHRRTVRIAWAAGIALAFLTLAAVVAGVFAIGQRNDARDSQARAEAEASRANQEADRANTEADRANTNAKAEAEARAEAVMSAQLARARELAAAAVTQLDVDPELSLLLAIQASDLAPASPEAASALREALLQHRALLTYTWPADKPADIVSGDLSPDGSLLVVGGGTGGHLEAIEVATGALIWEFDLAEGALGGAFPFFVDDGATVVIGSVWEADDQQPKREGIGGLHFIDAATGEQRRFIPVGECGIGGAGFNGRSDAYVLGVPVPCETTDDADEQIGLYRVDLATGEAIEVPSSLAFRVMLSVDESLLAHSEPGTVIDTSTGETILEVEDSTNQVAALSPDGSLLIVSERLGLKVIEVATGDIVARYFGHSPLPWNAWFSPDGTSAYSSGPDGTLQIWDPMTGFSRLEVPFGDGVWFSAVTPDLSRAAVFSLGHTVKVFDLGTENRSALLTYPAMTDAVAPFYHSFSLQIAGDRAVMSITDQATGATSVVVFDPETGAIVREIDRVTGQLARLSPDGFRVAVQTAHGGPTHAESIDVYDVDTGSVVATMADLCAWDFRVGPEPPCVEYPDRPFPEWIRWLRWSPDGRHLAAVGNPASAAHNAIMVWDTTSGEMIHTWRHDDDPVFGIEFSPDGSRLLFGLVNTLHALDTDNWTETTIWETEDTAPGQHIHYTSDGSTVAAAANAFWGVGDIVVLDAQGMEERLTITSAHDGGISAMAISPDDTLIASVGLDGMARVHEIATGDLMAELPVAPDVQANNVQFLDSETIVVTAGDRGLMFQLALDDSALLPVARHWLTRTFSDRECERYGLDPCPRLEELRGG